MRGLGNIIVENNTFKNWSGNAIQFARVANTYVDLRINSNKFINTIGSARVITVGGARRVEINNNKLKGATLQPVYFTSRLQVAYAPNSGKGSEIIQINNNWQRKNN